jgi:hypothetical protein
MKKPLLIGLASGLVIGFVLLAGCIGAAGPGKACGTDETCIKSAMATCEQAHGWLSIPYSSITTKLYLEVRSGTPSACTYYFRIENITLATGASAEAQTGAALMKGKDMTCVGAASNAEQMFTNMQGCTGSFVDLMKTFGVGGGYSPGPS